MPENTRSLFTSASQFSTSASAPSVVQNPLPDVSPAQAPAAKKPHIIVLGNEKGGCGKTTSCMHILVALLRLDFKVGSIDIDSRQRSLTRYIENRLETVQREMVQLPMPVHAVVQKSPFPQAEEAQKDERERFTRALSYVGRDADFVIIDSPGSDTYMSRLAHSFADTIITPINDSFVDLDVLANVDGHSIKVIKPSIYSEMVWEQKLQRAKRDGGAVDWIVMRNRLSNIDAKNKRLMTQVTQELSRRIGFRLAPGVSERVIFREMFLQGLTVLDIMEVGSGVSVSLSHVAARQEVRELLKTLKLPQVDAHIARSLEAEEKKKESADIAAQQPAEEKEKAQALAEPVPA